ncbi:hypothetical protein LHYA1_G001089 [Lachnellula hyalina]|uniref:DUF1993 domain-containing protein n=1 Tax=Lachnellula hyalina TaxID=1316788 RepID=A0A8H8U1L5_9HELO|nr:uncharacterized protein LHYA1_G001089 [Lachnellula hyalina]TVY30179.1 hypothetical protein LHYA1_G001089 [Lachnellula hyalina]
MAPLSLYSITIPPFLKQLRMLLAILEKGKAHSAGNEAKILESRLIEDMRPLVFQIQRASDSAKGVAVRVGKVEPESWPDNEETFPELEVRLKKTIAFLEKVDPKSMDGMEDQEVVMQTGSGERRFSATDYVLSYAIPNFYFHSVTAYGLLRKEGVPVGKKDFLGWV